MTSKANVLLVHGAWADGSCWAKVIPLLQEQGLNVQSVQIPLTSLREDIQVTQRMLRSLSGPTVLVGHSYGGAVITGAASQQDNVRSLVYISGFGLDEGESLDSLSKSGPPSKGSEAIIPDNEGFLWIKRDLFHSAFVADATSTEANVMAAVQKPLGLAAFTEASRAPAWKSISSWYLQCTEDKMIPPQAQAFMAGRMKANVHSIASSHAPFMAHAQDVSEFIARAC